MVLTKPPVMPGRVTIYGHEFHRTPDGRLVPILSREGDHRGLRDALAARRFADRCRRGDLLPPPGPPRGPRGSLQTWQETLVAQGVAGTLFNTYTTAKTVIPATSLYTFSPNFFLIGKTLRITVNGGLSNLVTTPGTVTMQVMLGTIVVFTTGAIQLNATAHTTLPFSLQLFLTCRAIGSGTSANFMGTGQLNGIMFTNTAAQVDAVNTTGEFPAPATAPAVGTGFDSTISTILDFWTGFSISSASNGIQVQQYIVEALN